MSLLTINKAIGYGMPNADFYQNIKLPIGRGVIRNELQACLPRTSHISYTDDGETVGVSGSMGLSGLFIPVGDLFEEPEDFTDSHMIIFPTQTEKTKWYRGDDHIDQLAMKVAGDHTLKGVVYLDDPIHPHSVYMDRNGVEVVPKNHGGDPALVPGIPHVMRWWLLRYGVFDLTGIAKLRPLLAEWWD